MSILEVHDVSIRYMTGDFKDIGLKEYLVRRAKNDYHVNEFWADKNVSFSLERGDMLGIIGTNGAGKSTLLKAISGIMEPTGGWVKREGSIAALLELASGFDGDLTVRENTYLRGAMLGYTRKFMDEMYDQIIEFAELQDFQDRPFKQLSSGMKSRLAFAIASLVKPDILILDEVLSVGDGAFRKKSEAKMREIIEGGATTILVSHSIEQVREMCSKVLWLHKGKLIAYGDDVQGICDQYQGFLEGRADLPSQDGKNLSKSSGRPKSHLERREPREMGNKCQGIIQLQLNAICLISLMLIGCILAYKHSPLFFVSEAVILLFCGWQYRKRQKLVEQIRSLFSKNAGNNFRYSFAFTVCFSIAAHGFLFANEFFSHDSITYTYYSTGTFQFYAGIGRFIIPLYEVIKGAYAAPWLIGLFFVAWMTLTCFFVAEFLQAKGRLAVAMISGLLCTNAALTLTGATYIYCLDEYALSLLAAVVAAYFFCKVPKGKVFGIFLLIWSLAIFQTYFTVAVSLCFISAVHGILKNNKTQKIIIDGLLQIGAMLISFGIYFLTWTSICSGLGIAKQRTNETLLGKGIAGIGDLLVQIYGDYFKTFFNTEGVLGYAYAAANVFLLILLLKAFLSFLKAKDINFSNKILMIVMMLCVPLVFGSAEVVLAGKASQLTIYAYELVYIFFLLWRDWETGREGESRKEIRMVAALLICCIIYNNVAFSNQAYIKKDLEKTATISLVTRIIDRVEVLEGYQPQETQVYIVGDLRYSSLLNKGQHEVAYLKSRTGLSYNYSATYNLLRYITDYMNYPMSISLKQSLAELEEVQNMPPFPAAGSVKMIDGAAVIKLS